MGGPVIRLSARGFRCRSMPGQMLSGTYLPEVFYVGTRISQLPSTLYPYLGWEILR